MSNYVSINGWRGHAFFLAKKIKLLNRYDRWRKAAKILKLSKKARDRLEWFVFYHTRAKENALLTCRHFGISAKTFYKWKNRFDHLSLRSLEDQSRAPTKTRDWQITPLKQQRIIKLRKEYIRWGKGKIANLPHYFNYQSMVKPCWPLFLLVNNELHWLLSKRKH